MNALLQVSDLVVDHGRLRALWNVSLEVGPGERVGLLGANGAGKSTTVGAIIGVYPPRSGEIRLRDEVITRYPPNAIVSRGIALVPEGRRLFTGMTVLENLEMGAYVGEARRQRRQTLDRVFTMFPVLKEKARQNAGELSGGQQQMVAIGRALMAQPRLLLLDEPFLGVAPIIVQEVMDALRLIAERGVSILLVEQNIHRALEFVDRAFVIENGRMALDGTSDELANDPDFSTKFLGLD